MMPETRLLHKKYFATKRFDRLYDRSGQVGGKIHTVSAAGLLEADYRVPSLSYEGLITLTRVLTKDQSQVEQFFRRMVFNIIIGNRDDHAKNFAFQMDQQGKWALAPAYDILPSVGFNGFHTTVLYGEGRPSNSDLFKAGTDEVGLSSARAKSIIEEIEDRCHNLGI
jgi:serine/threonine-protein kinase HipA